MPWVVFQCNYAFFVHQGLYYIRKLFFSNYTGSKYIENKPRVVRLPEKVWFRLTRPIYTRFSFLSLVGFASCMTPAGTPSVTIHPIFLSITELLHEHMGTRRTKELGHLQPSSGLPFRLIAEFLLSASMNWSQLRNSFHYLCTLQSELHPSPLITTCLHFIHLSRER